MSRVWYNNTIIPSRYIVNPINAKIKPSVSNVANDATGADVYASFDWEEVTR